MKTALSVLLAASLLATGVAGCATAPPDPVSVAVAVPAEGDPARAADPALATAINEFGFDLMRRVPEGEPAFSARRNLIVSPLSVHAALTMTLNGARGETAEEMASVLRLGTLGLEDANLAYADLLAALAELDASRDTTLTVANSLWPDLTIDLEADFLESNQRFFGAALEQIDLRTPDAADRMNAWVAEQTAGDITELIDEVPDLAVLYLINALHLDAAWAEPFSESDTRDREFRVSPGEVATVPFMHQAGTFRYAESSGWYAVRLPLAGGRLATWVALPAEYDCGNTANWLDSNLDRLDTSTWRQIVESAEERHGEVALPTLSSAYHTDLEASLATMGMPSAFDARADFSAITGAGGLWMGPVLHGTRLDLSESGVRASAATAVSMMLKALPEEDSFEMVVDRPFLIAIEDEPTGTLLFLGAIYDPR